MLFIPLCFALPMQAFLQRWHYALRQQQAFNRCKLHGFSGWQSHAACQHRIEKENRCHVHFTAPNYDTNHGWCIGQGHACLDLPACVLQERLAEERAKKDAQAKEAAAARSKTADASKPDEKDRRAQNGDVARDARDRGRDGRERSDRDRAEQGFRERDRDRMPARSDRSVFTA